MATVADGLSDGEDLVIVVGVAGRVLRHPLDGELQRELRHPRPGLLDVELFGEAATADRALDVRRGSRAQASVRRDEPYAPTSRRVALGLLGDSVVRALPTGSEHLHPLVGLPGGRTAVEDDERADALPLGPGAAAL